jgi:hypothetical protein
MKLPFELEWMGGAAEHHFRKARPGIDDLVRDILDPLETIGIAIGREERQELLAQ